MDITTDMIPEKNGTVTILKRFFLTIGNGSENINRANLIQFIIDRGFLMNDPRLEKFFRGVEKCSDNITYQEFEACVENHICVLKPIFLSELIIPKFDEFSSDIDGIYEQTLDCTDGSNADYIPQLARVDPEQYGISVCTIDGQRFNRGHSSTYFSVQSCCKPINYAMALETLGEEYVHTYVGREPSGQAFNELLLNKKGKPHNPLINSGAIMTTSLLFPEDEMSIRFEKITDIWERLSGGIHKIGFNNSVFLSERSTADRNYALAYFMQEKNENKRVGFPDKTDLNETLELYFQSCSIEVNTEILSIVASTLANGGVNPFTGETIFSSKTVQNVLSMMLTCGMYDYSGEFAFKIGFPAKSGVAGAIMIVVPNVMGIATWSPRLDDIGNSYRGIEFCKILGSSFSFHIFDNINDETKKNPLVNKKNEEIHQFSDLCMAAQQGDVDYLKILFNRRVDLNQADYDGRTPLHIAVSERNIEVCKFLINVARVDVNKEDRWKTTPLKEALSSDNPELHAVFHTFAK
jgi:glutaminase